jgi:alkaline phosphatase
MSRITAVVTVLIAVFALAPVAPAYTLSEDVNAVDLSFYQAPTATSAYPLTGNKTVRNVIVCIGDGMGLSQITLASFKGTGLDGRLAIERMPVTGLVRTRSANSIVTDSAASGTALASGIKTNNGMIGMAPDGTAYCTILEAAKARGMATGLVVTSTISHATPASFASHVKSRTSEARIAEQLIANRVNVVLGGGRKFFLPRSDPNSARKDDRNLVAEAKEAGYVYVTTGTELQAAGHPYLLGLFQLDPLTTAANEPTLAALTQKAIQVLSQVKRKPPFPFFEQKAGFFLMVEGSQIDWACHINDIRHTIRQTLLFDQAVQAAVDFALRDGHTLVIVTADHETGGLTFTNPPRRSMDPTTHWSTKGSDAHTGSPVLIGAVGPRAELFAGVQDNTDIPKKIAALLKIKPFPRPVE